jgi:hypothetical protein
MNITEAIQEREEIKKQLEKLRYRLIDLDYNIEKFCESKIGYVVEQFGNKYFIQKHSNGILLGILMNKDDSVAMRRNGLEFVYPDKCVYLGKAKKEGYKILLLK